MYRNLIKKAVFLIIIFLSNYSIFPQTDTINNVKYTPGYEFNEGVFVSFEQVKMNKPINPARIVFDYDIESFDYIDELVKQDNIYFVDDFGVKQNIETKSIWGFSKRGTLYINYNYEFNRIPVVGSISHFIADMTVIRDRMSDPFSYNNYYSPLNSTYSTKEMRQYLLDFNSGKIYQYNFQSVEVLFMQDPEIFDEFNLLKKKKKKKLLFFYIRKFNEKNPLYLPKN